MRNRLIKWVVVLLLLPISFYAQDISIGAGVLEQSRSLGNHVALSTSINQPIDRNFGVTAVYTYGVLQTGNVSMHFIDDSGNPDVLYLPKKGDKFQQLQLLANYKFYSNDDNIAVRLNAGAARQISGNIFPSFGLDLIGFPKNKFYPYLSWSPVIRDGFGEGEGWSHTVTVNLTFKI